MTSAIDASRSRSGSLRAKDGSARRILSISLPAGGWNQRRSAGAAEAAFPGFADPSGYFVLLKSGVRFSLKAVMPSRALSMQAE
jgi:hypothetical protein